MLLLHCVKIDARRNVEMATLYFFSSCRMLIYECVGVFCQIVVNTRTPKIRTKKQIHVLHILKKQET